MKIQRVTYASRERRAIEIVIIVDGAFVVVAVVLLLSMSAHCRRSDFVVITPYNLHAPIVRVFDVFESSLQVGAECAICDFPVLGAAAI